MMRISIGETFLEGKKVMQGIIGKVHKIAIDFKKVDPSFTVDFFDDEKDLIYSFKLDETEYAGELTGTKVVYPRKNICNNTGVSMSYNGDNLIFDYFVVYENLEFDVQGLGSGKILGIKVFFE